MKKNNFFCIVLFACIFFFTSCKRDEFTVTFDPSGSNDPIVTQIFTEKVAQPLIENTFTHRGFAFSNWNTTPEGTGKTYRNRETIKVLEHMILYAQWIPFRGTFLITFNANGGTGNMKPQVFTDFETKELTANAFMLTNHNFINWNTKADGSGYRYRDKKEVSLFADMELFAQWAKKPESCPGISTVDDIDGNTYQTVQIGTQCWMRENLKTTKFKTGVAIPVITDNWDWITSNTAAMCYFDNNISNAEQLGALYNAYVVHTENLCPDGWHVPSNEEWDKLTEYLGGPYNAGYKMKTINGWHLFWGEEDGNGSNESGFSALPAGYRSYNFSYLGYAGYFWSSSKFINYGSSYCLNGDDNSLNFIIDTNKEYGLSVRCIKN